MANRPPNLLIVEDDLDAAELLRETLADHYGCDTTTHVTRVAEALALDLDRFDLVLSDLNLPDGTGLELIVQMLAQRADLPIVMVTSESGLDVATEAIRIGAYDYVVKAGDYLFTVPLVVQKNLAVWRTKQDNLTLHRKLEQTLDEVRIKNQQLEELVKQLEQQATTDPLTGLANRRSIQQQLERSFAEAERYGSDLACAMIDLDGFKQVNDGLGHQTGDKLLQTAARVLSANCRRSDVAGRYGGDEFVLLLPQTDPPTAMGVLDRIREQFIEAVAPLVGELPCNMSMGLACVSVNRATSADQLVALADAALYEAKDAGKGRTRLHGAEPKTPNYTV